MNYSYLGPRTRDSIRALINGFPERSRRLITQMNDSVLVMDGAMGTVLERQGLDGDDYGGEAHEGLNEKLNISKPEIVKSVYLSYLKAGADLITTNTFGAHPVVLQEFGLEQEARKLAYEGARLARLAVAEWEGGKNLGENGSKPAQKMAGKTGSTGVREAFVAGSLGPTSKSLMLTGGVSFEAMAGGYAKGVSGLTEGGADLILFETVMDPINLKAAFEGADRAFEELGRRLPIMVSVTIEPGGTTLTGQNIEAFLTSFLHRPLFALGLNCSTGPDLMREPLEILNRLSPFPVSCYPNAGLPDEDGNYTMEPAAFAREMKVFSSKGWLNLVGGCCGTTPDHIKALVQAVRGVSPRAVDQLDHGDQGEVSGDGFRSKTVLSGMESIEIDSGQGPYFIGERTNVLGSRKFKNLISQGCWEEAADLGVEQTAAGADLLDVCLQNPDRDEEEDIKRFLSVLVRRLRTPVVVDSTHPDVVETAARHIGGKGLINSVNMEDGGARLERIAWIARRYGMAVIFGCIDTPDGGGMALDRASKLEVALKGFSLLTDKYGMAPEDVMIDPLVFPCGTGDQRFFGSARETIEGVRLIKREIPSVKVVLGISNVSFGLPQKARPILNSVFLHLCVDAGLDLPIADPRRILSYSEVTEEDRRACLSLLNDGGRTSLDGFVQHVGGRYGPGAPKEATTLGSGGAPSALSSQERVVSCIMRGNVSGMRDALDELSRTMKPLEIINGVLLQGMDEVGKLFGKNKIIIAEVLRSAEVMNEAVDYLRTHLNGVTVGHRGKILLATVKGDVHDIGKSLVDIIFSNNGYDVVDLGVKVSVQKILEGARGHEPDIICLSGLLVRSAHQMAVTAAGLHDAGISVPILVGGAALSEVFTQKVIRPAYGGAVVEYARDVMEGLEIAGRLVGGRSGKAHETDQEANHEADNEADHEVDQIADNKIEPAEQMLDSTHQEIEPMNQEFDPIDHEIEHEVQEFNSPNKDHGFKPIFQELEPPVPVDWEVHLVEDITFADLQSEINFERLYRRILGVKKGVLSRKEKAKKTDELIKPLLEKVKREETIIPRAAYRFVRASSEGDIIHLQVVSGEHVEQHVGDRPGGEATVTSSFDLTFPRRKSDPKLCLSDFVRSGDLSGEPADSLALFVATCGLGVGLRAKELERDGRYLESVILQSLAVEGAEALARMVHQRIMSEWRDNRGCAQASKSLREKASPSGNPPSGPPPDGTPTVGPRTESRGLRVSPGYSCCPDLSITRVMIELLDASSLLGVELTDECMMDPEASISALVFHHPHARYFTVT